MEPPGMVIVLNRIHPTVESLRFDASMDRVDNLLPRFFTKLHLKKAWNGIEGTCAFDINGRRF